jgi:hypothetical protein
MEFTLSFHRHDDPNTTYVLTTIAGVKEPPVHLIDFVGGKAKISPEHGYGSVLEIRAHSARNDRIELYYLDAQKNKVVHATIQEDATPPLEKGASLEICIGSELLFSKGKILRCSWL